PADEDPADGRGGLQPGRRVDDVAGGHRLALGRARVDGDERLAGVDAEPQLDALLLRPVADRERRPDRPLGVVLVRGGRAEERHHRVADELLDRAAEAFELGPQRGLQPLEERGDVLGVERLRARREAREIAEQDRHDLALAAPLGLHAWSLGVEERVPRARREAVGGEERDARVAGPERVAAAAALGASPFDPGECVDGEAPGPVEPAPVLCTLEGLEEGIAVPGGAMADRRALLPAVRAGPPDELGRGEQELLVEVVGSRADDARRAAAPLEPDLAVGTGEVRPLEVGPVREARLDEGGAREDRGGVALERPTPLVVQRRPERLDVPDEPVRRPEAAELVAVETLDPEAVGAAPREQRIRGLPARVAPARRARAAEELARGDERPRRTPHHVLGLVVDVRPDELVNAVLELRARREPPRDEEDAGLAGEESGNRRVGKREAALEVRPRAEELERAKGERRQVEAGLREPTVAQLGKREDDAGRADVHVLHGARRAPAVPGVGAPEQARPAKGRLGVGSDRADPRAHARLVPRVVDERLERLGLVERGYPE